MGEVIPTITKLKITRRYLVTVSNTEYNKNILKISNYLLIYG